MRFPWLQVDTDFISARSKDFASLLGVSRREALGIAVDLWMWVLGRASDTTPPNGFVLGANAPRLIAGAAEWAGDPGLFIDALEGAGLASWEHEGVRLKGFDRYMRTWEKNARRKADKQEKVATEESTGKKPAESDGKPATILPLDADADAKEEKHLRAVPAVASGNTEQPPFTLEPVGKPERKPSPQQRLFSALQATRKERCEEVSEPWVEERWSIQQQNARLKAECSGPDEAKERLEGAWAAYLADDGQRVREPAWSLGYFLSPGVRARYETKAVREALT